MPIKIVKRYSCQMCRDNPDWLFVFGDNLLEYGKGGQAVIRSEHNAHGIPTKRAPNNSPNAFLYDKDYDEVYPDIRDAFRYVRNYLLEGKTVVWPEDGIGTGLARLPETSPKIFALIDSLYKKLLSRFGSV